MALSLGGGGVELAPPSCSVVMGGAYFPTTLMRTGCIKRALRFSVNAATFSLQAHVRTCTIMYTDECTYAWISLPNEP